MKMTIDGIEIPIKKGQTILEAAQNGGVYIPTLCAHKDLPPFGACRICIVKVDGMRGFPPACTTPATEGMVVHSEEDSVKKLRRNILRLILTEHPHSCIVCNVRGDCEKMRGGLVKAGRITGCTTCPNRPACEIREVCDYLDMENVDIPMEYKNLPLERYDPFLDRDYNLCILCGRCVRMCQLVRGAGAIAFTNRSHETKVGTIFGRTHLEGACRFCGACIDVCPTGALSPKGSKWHGKPDTTIESICTFCSMNCAMLLEKKWDKVMAAVPDRQKGYGRAYACVYGRFCIPAFLNGTERLHYPLIRKKGLLSPVSWEEAFRFIADSLDRFTPEEIGFLVSPYLTNESAYLTGKLAREVLNCHNIDILSRFGRVLMHYLASKGIAERNWPTLDDVEESDWLVLVNNDMVFTHAGMPVAIHKAREKGTKIVILDDCINELQMESDLNVRMEPGSLRTFLAALTKLLLNRVGSREIEGIQNFDVFIRLLEELSLTDAIELSGVQENQFNEITEILLSSKNGAFIVGSRIMEDPEPQQIIAGIHNLLTILGMDKGFIPLIEEGNVRGVSEAGCLYGYRPGYEKDNIPGEDYIGMIEGIGRGEIKALLISEGSIPPESLGGAEFIVLTEIYPSSLDSIADVILPAAAFSEEDGHFNSLEGRELKLQKVVEPPGMALPEWKIVSGLAQTLKAEGFAYEASDDIRDEMWESVPSHGGEKDSSIPVQKELIPVKEPAALHLLEYTPYLARYRGTPIHELVEDLRIYLEENDRIPREKNKVNESDNASCVGGAA